MRPIADSTVHPNDIDNMVDTMHILFEGLGPRDGVFPRDMVGLHRSFKRVHGANESLACGLIVITRALSSSKSTTTRSRSGT